MKSLVVGVVGHVDHGKTSLVKALTGIDTDRLPEEKKREMSIEPGFAFLKLPSGINLEFIDVPGHERLIHNMLKGIWSIDIAILVVAADDGVMPQTVEHLNILKLLGVKNGLVVITKIDIVKQELLYLVTDEVKKLVNKTFLEDPPIIYFSFLTKEGRSQLIEELDKIANQTAQKKREKPFRLSIDRFFTYSGLGTIVTGTIASGEIRKGEEIQIYPKSQVARVRSLQVHREEVDKAIAGQRVGINLSGVKIEEIKRGMTLGKPNDFIPHFFFNARLFYLPNNEKPLFNREKVKIYHGATEALGRVILIERERILPGESAFAQIRLEEKIVSLPFDRFIIRSLSPPATIGGGIILEIQPKKYRQRERGTSQRLEKLERSNEEGIIEELTKKSLLRPFTLKEISQKAGFSPKRTLEIIEKLTSAGNLLTLSDKTVVHKIAFENLKELILNKMTALCQKNSLHSIFTKEELRTQISPYLSPKLFDYALNALAKERKIIINGISARLVNMKVELTSTQKLIQEKLIQKFQSLGRKPLWSSEIEKILPDLPLKEVKKVLHYLLEIGMITCLNDGSFLFTESLNKMKKEIEEYLNLYGKIDILEAKNVLKLGRRATIAILEHLDNLKITTRDGNYRILIKDKRSD